MSTALFLLILSIILASNLATWGIIFLVSRFLDRRRARYAMSRYLYYMETSHLRFS